MGRLALDIYITLVSSGPVFKHILLYFADPEEAIYDDVPRENSDSEPGLITSRPEF